MVVLPGSLVFLAFFTVGNAFREAKDEEFPFQVSIQTLEKRHLCGGAILTSNWVLTSDNCLRDQVSVRVCYGSADSKNPQAYVMSKRIHQQEFTIFNKKRLALIELESPIKFSKTTKQASFPKATVHLRNTTKLSGWKNTQDTDQHPRLFVSDSYFVITDKCRTIGGTFVQLEADEFCGIDKESQNYLYDLGSTVSKSAIVLGILTDIPLSMNQPFIYVKLSEHGKWIEDVLQSDAQNIIWVNEVPKDSAPSNCMMSLALLGISAIFLRFI